MEVLSPAGNYRSAMAAFVGGADAVYLGGKSFSARMGANNFSDEELTSIVDFAHSIGKKVYVTLNTLLFQDEFMPAVDFAIFLYEIAVDGIIVQDLGLASYLHQVVPGLPLHASTQLNCHNIEQAKALKEAGFVRVVLARECPKEFIAEVKALGLEVEVFVHGALCVCYSGNCLLSSFIGGRSGNRGRCAQPCRMTYNLYEDGEQVLSNAYAISTKDLETLDNVAKLKDFGVDSLKIEGRLKSEAYVYQTTLVYRDAVDGYIDHEEKNKLKALYSRGFTKGFINDESPFQLLNQKTNSHQGERIGKVIKTHNKRVSIQLEKEVHRLDGIRFNGPAQLGLALEKFFVKGEPKELGKPGEIIEISSIDFADKVMGLEVIRTTDHNLESSIAKIVDEGVKVAVFGTLKIELEKPLELTVSFGDKSVTVVGGKAEKPLKSGTPRGRIVEQLKKSGEYPYAMKVVEVEGDDAFIPISALNALRNEAYEKLQAELTKHNVYTRQQYRCEKVAESSPFTLLATSKKVAIPHYFDSIYAQNRVIYGQIEHRVNELLPFICKVPEGVNAIASPYCNITNSYALDFFFSMGFSSCLVSLEVDKSSIEAMMEDYQSRHGVYPNVGIFAYGYPEMMIMKSCPIGTAFKSSKLHCGRCHLRKYELEDRFGVRYPLEGDSSCTTTIYGNKPIYLLDRLDELIELHLSSALLSFALETGAELEEVLSSLEDGPIFQKDAHSRGHYQKRSL